MAAMQQGARRAHRTLRRADQVCAFFVGNGVGRRHDASLDVPGVQIIGRDASAVASRGDRIPMDPLTKKRRALSRVEALALASTGGSYEALFKAVLAACGDFVSQSN